MAKMDPYEEHMSGKSSGYGGYQRQAPSGLDYGNLGLSVVGTALQGFGAYQAYRDAEAQKREERRRYEEQQRIQAEERKKAEEQARVQNMLGYGGYAKGQQDRRNQAYQGYAARIGL